MFENIQFGVQERIAASRVIFNAIRDPVPIQSQEQQAIDNVLKGTFFVLLYGTLEYSITSVVSDTIQCINEKNINHDLVKPRLLSLSLDPFCNSIRDGRSKKWVHQHKLFTKLEEPTSFNAETYIFPAERGNIKCKQLAFIWEVFDIKVPLFPDERYRSYFDALAEHRMAISHGRKTPQEIGRNVSKNELRAYLNAINHWCSYLFSCFETYCQNQEYLK